MRISDWSSDVCSSDLVAPRRERQQDVAVGRGDGGDEVAGRADEALLAAEGVVEQQRGLLLPRFRIAIDGDALAFGLAQRRAPLAVQSGEQRLGAAAQVEPGRGIAGDDAAQALRLDQPGAAWIVRPFGEPGEEGEPAAAVAAGDAAEDPIG